MAIYSPLMKRVHQARHSEELCFIDFSGNMEQENCRGLLFFFSYPHLCWRSPPWGFLIQSEDEATILLECLQLLKDILREDAFAGSGQADPHLITDDCKAKRGALGRPFPGSKLLLCTFHLLQAVWLWREA